MAYVPGSHIEKRGAFDKGIKDYFAIPKNRWRPVQLFSGSPRSWARKNPSEEEISRTHALLSKYSVLAFIHSIYLCNLALPPAKFKLKNLPYLEKELKLGSSLRFKGVVVHFGKSLNLVPDVAKGYMEMNLRTLLPFIDSSCPLLLETCAGTGTELCKTYREVAEFYGRFVGEERKKIKLCLDTCHVFAAGYDPLSYLLALDLKFPSSLTLVHFNDSKKKKGSRKDRHARYGTGYIPLKSLEGVCLWCRGSEIPMVIE